MGAHEMSDAVDSVAVPSHAQGTRNNTHDAGVLCTLNLENK